MAGRGRGRGASNSFSREVIERIGIEGGGSRSESQSEAILEPPPLYPPLENYPVPLNLGVEGEYLLALKRDFVEYFHDSACYLQHTVTKTDIERYSDRYQTAALASRSIKELIHDWSNLPAELKERSSHRAVRRKRKLPQKKISVKVAKKSEEITNRLEELEKWEEQGEDGEDVADAEGQQTENKEGDKDADSEVEEDIEEEDLDEEMDDGTDYINSYFDNGEDYIDDEDDNLDDGPIY